MSQPRHHSKTHLLGNIECTRTTRSCTGIKHCEYLAEDIKLHFHTDVANFNWQMLKTERSQAYTSQRERVTG
jgi:hypothetical protein